MKLVIYILLACSLIFMTSCGGGEKKEEKQSTKIGVSKEVKKTTAGETVKIELTSNDIMQFNTKKIKVPAGSSVELTLKHIGKQELKIMGHNFVLLKQGTNMVDFAIAASKAGANGDWIPNNKKAVLAHTKMIGGGETTTITFKAPGAGTYDFICSFPGHSNFMKGKFIVE